MFEDVEPNRTYSRANCTKIATFAHSSQPYTSTTLPACMSGAACAEEVRAKIKKKLERALRLRRASTQRAATIKSIAMLREDKQRRKHRECSTTTSSSVVAAVPSKRRASIIVSDDSDEAEVPSVPPMPRARDNESEDSIADHKGRKRVRLRQSDDARNCDEYTVVFTDEEDDDWTWGDHEDTTATTTIGRSGLCRTCPFVQEACEAEIGRAHV